MNSHTPRNTSILLILLTFAAGIALGWLLRDMRAPGGLAITPTVVPAQAPTATATAAATITSAPTSAPTTTATSVPSATTAPTATVTPTATTVPTATPQVVGYTGYRVRAGDTLESIAARSGSLPQEIGGYNLLEGEPAPGSALIIPLLSGATNTLGNEPLLVERGSAEQPWIAFTLDAGANAEPVPEMLATLRERSVTITFFLTGTWIRDNPYLAREIVADGHEIANHTVTHADLRTLDDDAIRAEVRETDRLMREITGVGTRPFFRPPFGAYDDRVLQIVQSEGFLPIYWTLDSLDSVGEPKTPEFLVERVTARLTPEQLRGAIILAHCGSAATAAALPEILDRFSAMGLEVRKLSEVRGIED